MSWKKLTPAIKKQITHEWHALFPELGIYKPMHLLNRVGPLLVGILLEVKSGNNSYTPTFHVHNLTRPFPVVSLSLKLTLNQEYVHMEWHESKHRKLAEQMRDVAYIAFGGDLRLHDILAGYKHYFEQFPMQYQIQDYEDMALISAWCGNVIEIQRCLQLAEQHMNAWPPFVLKQIGEVKNYLNNIEEKSRYADTLRTICDQQVAALNVENLPVRKLLC